MLVYIMVYLIGCISELQAEQFLGQLPFRPTDLLLLIWSNCSKISFCNTLIFFRQFYILKNQIEMIKLCDRQKSEV